MQMDKVRVEQEEKRKTLVEETQQHHQVDNNNLTPAQYLNKKPLPPGHLKLLTNINKIPEIFNPKTRTSVCVDVFSLLFFTHFLRC